MQREAIGSVGMDVWLAAIAYGAAQVVLLVPPPVASSVVAELEAQLAVAGDILGGMGYPRGALRLLRNPDDDQMITELAATEPRFTPRPAGFAGLNEKRTVIRLAVDHLFREAPAPRPLVSLPAGAPFGDVLLDEKRCTLCMACVSQCPGKALLAGDAGSELGPELRFVEENCVQCALCARSCPEDAIAPTPRLSVRPGSRTPPSGPEVGRTFLLYPLRQALCHPRGDRADNRAAGGTCGVARGRAVTPADVRRVPDRDHVR